MADLIDPRKEPEDFAAYEAIKAAVMETARGRWFLEEYTRQNRNADTDVLLKTLDRIEGLVNQQGGEAPIQRIRIDLLDMSSVIARTRAEIAAMQKDGEGAAPLNGTTMELQSIVSTTEHATSEILAAAEKVQEITWTMREAGADTEVCDELDNQAMEIYTGCSFQDLTGQRIQKVVQTVEYLEDRINAMMALWDNHDVGEPAVPTIRDRDKRPDAHLLNGPAKEGEGIEQHDVDSLFNPGHDNAGDASDDNTQGIADRLFEHTGDDDTAASAEPAVAEVAEAEAAEVDVAAIEEPVAEPAAPAPADEVETTPSLAVASESPAVSEAAESDSAAPIDDDILEPAEDTPAASLAMDSHDHYGTEAEATLDSKWDEAEEEVVVSAKHRTSVADVDLSALTGEQKQVLFS